MLGGVRATRGAGAAETRAAKARTVTMVDFIVSPSRAFQRLAEIEASWSKEVYWKRGSLLSTFDRWRSTSEVPFGRSH